MVAVDPTTRGNVCGVDRLEQRRPVALGCYCFLLYLVHRFGLRQRAL